MDDCIDIKICSLNVRGLGNSFKRRCVFNWIRNTDCHVCFLQETHSKVSSEKIWCQEWGYKIIFNHGRSDSAGVCMLLKPSATFDVLNTVKDDGGRTLLVTLKINESIITLVNIYGPNIDDDSFFVELHNLMIEHGEEPYIIGGDFNTILDPKFDKFPNLTQNHPKCVKVVKDIISDFELIDIWRSLNSTQLKYTWMSHDCKIGSRIDYFLVSESLVTSVVNCDISFGYKTDHSLISLSLLKSVVKRGPGFWKLNTSLLANKEDVQIIRNEINAVLHETEYTDPQKIWEFLKFKVRQKFIQISKQKKRHRQEKLARLESDINDLTNAHNPSNNVQLSNDLKCKKREYEELQEEVVRGIIVRTKAKWIAEGERNTKYFFNLEKRNYQQKCISRLQGENGIIINDAKCILEEERSFYSRLYTSNNTGVSSFTLLDHLKLPKLDFNDTSTLGDQISEKECYEAIMTFANDKSPGSDGLPAEFYKVFWPEIKNLLCSVYNNSFQVKSLPQSMRRSVISLLPKKGKDLLLLKNWRPISLLNSDYKILAKLLSLRIKKVLPHLISNDQYGFLKGRYIGENIRLFIDILIFCKTHNVKGVALSIDFEKAFDMIEWDFIYYALNIFGFDPRFIQWVQVLYFDIEGCVINNGFSSKSFEIQRGVRQGCPLSPYLFIIAAELLGCLIRQNNEIKGLKVYDMEVKISQYADDTTIFLEPDEANIKRCVKVLDDFKDMSGLRINIEKCNMIRLGNFSEILCHEIPFNWPSESFMYLGVNIPLNSDFHTFYDLNYKPRFEEIRNTLNIWSCRTLTLYGKIVIIKSLIISKLIYFLSIVPNPPMTFFAEVQQLLFRFLWNNKNDKIKRSLLYNDYHEGGLKMPHLLSFNHAMKITWVKRYLDESNTSKWKIFFKMALKNVGGDNFMKWNLSVDHLSFVEGTDPFWKDVLIAWSYYRYFNPVKFKDIISQPLWFNSNILIDGKPIFVKKWSESNMNYISDILKCDYSFMSFDQVSQKYGLQSFLSYFSILSAIPKCWKDIIKKGTEELSSCQFDEYLDKFLKQKKVSKLCYPHFIKNYRISLSETDHQEKWQSDLAVNLRDSLIWKARFSLIFKSSIDNKMRNFQFKFIHRKIATQFYLSKIGVSDTPNCNFCDSHPQTLIHLFLKCVNVTSLWREIFTWLKSKNVRHCKLTEEEICFGTLYLNQFYLVNTIILHAKYFIFLCKVQNTVPLFMSFLSSIKHLEKTERIIALKRNRLELHEKKWQALIS